MKRNPYENDLANLRRDYGFSKDFMRSTRKAPKVKPRCDTCNAIISTYQNRKGKGLCRACIEAIN